jgi:hypothetical protein
LTPAVAAEYALFDRNGRLVVEDDIYQQYYSFIDNHPGFYQATPQAFAMYMLFGANAEWIGTNSNGDEFCQLHEAERYAYFNSNSANSTYTTEQQERMQELRKEILLMLFPEQNPDDNNPEFYGDFVAIYEVDRTTNPNFNEEEYNKLLNEFLTILYTPKNGENDVYSFFKANTDSSLDYEHMTPEDRAMDVPLFNYYMHMFQAIQSAGGCVSIETFDGFNGNAANDSEWLTSMISSGLMSISTIDVDKKGNISFNGTSPSSDESINYTTTSTIDSTAVKKAEAKYEHELKQINRKDKKFDLDLSKLDTERNALKTEYDSVKKVIEDNIDRSFGIFS